MPVPDSPSPPSSPDPNSNPTPTPFLSALHSFPLSKSPPTADPTHQPPETPLSSAIPSLNPNPNPNSPSINPIPNSPSPSPTFNPNPNHAETLPLPRHQLQHPSTSTSTSTCTSKRKTLHNDDAKAGGKAKKSLPHPMLPVQDQPCQPRSQPIFPPSPSALPEITNLQQIIQHLSGDFDEAKYADMDILDIAEKKGIIFDDPPWWPPGGFPDTI